MRTRGPPVAAASPYCRALLAEPPGHGRRECKMFRMALPEVGFLDPARRAKRRLFLVLSPERPMHNVRREQLDVLRSRSPSEASWLHSVLAGFPGVWFGGASRSLVARVQDASEPTCILWDSLIG